MTGEGRAAAAPWLAAVGQDLAVETVEGADVAGTPTGPWRCVDCTEPSVAGGWVAWQVGFDAPGAVPQGTVGLVVPGLGSTAVFVVPAAATAHGTRLIATFTVPDVTTEEDR